MIYKDDKITVTRGYLWEIEHLLEAMRNDMRMRGQGYEARIATALEETRRLVYFKGPKSEKP